MCNIQVIICGTLTMTILIAQQGSDGPVSHFNLCAPNSSQKTKASKTKDKWKSLTISYHTQQKNCFLKYMYLHSWPLSQHSLPHTHTYMHIHIHTCTHAYIHAHTHTYMHTHAHIHAHTHKLTHLLMPPLDFNTNLDISIHHNM